MSSFLYERGEELLTGRIVSAQSLVREVLEELRNAQAGSPMKWAEGIEWPRSRFSGLTRSQLLLAVWKKYEVGQPGPSSEDIDSVLKGAVLAELVAEWDLHGELLLCITSSGRKYLDQLRDPSNSGRTQMAKHIWIDEPDLMALPMIGAAWEYLADLAEIRVDAPDLSDQEDRSTVFLMAKGLAYMRTGEEALKKAVEDGCRAAMGTEERSRALALGRNLVAWAVAADCVGYRTSEALDWAARVRRAPTVDGPPNLIASHEQRPNNWGAWAGASRIALSMYVEDVADVQQAAKVFQGYLGDRKTYAGFKYGTDLSWQADPAAPVGINPKGASKNMRSIDGVLPDDQRRAGSFRWPPPVENYVREALQGVVAQAHLLKRAGLTPWTWSDYAIFRAVRWFLDVAKGKFDGDDEATPHVVNFYVPLAPEKPKPFAAVVPARYGKGYCGADWIFGPH